MLLSRFSYLATQTSRLSLVAALTFFTNGTLAYATTYTNGTPGGTVNIYDGDVGQFINGANASSTFSYSPGGGGLGDGTTAIIGYQGNGLVYIGGATDINGSVGSSSDHVGKLVSDNGDLHFKNDAYINTFELSDNDIYIDNGSQLSVGNVQNYFSDGGGSLNFGTSTFFNYAGTVGTTAKRIDHISTDYDATWTSSGGMQTISTVNGVNLTNDTLLRLYGTGTTFNGNGGIMTDVDNTGSVVIGSNVTLQGTTLGNGGGHIGDSTHRVRGVSISGSGNTLTTDGSIYDAGGFGLRNNTLTMGGSTATTLAANGVLTFATGQGTINFIGSGGTTVNSDLGNSTYNINQVNLNTTASTVTLNGNNYINSLNFASDTQLRLGANKSLTVGTLSNTSGGVSNGSLYFSGGNTFTYNGQIGNSGSQQTKNTILNGNNTFVSAGGINRVYVGANGLNFNDDGILTINGTGTTFVTDYGIQSTTNGQGTLNIGSNVIVQAATFGNATGYIGGDATHRLNAITFANASGNSFTNDGSVYLTNGINLKDNTLTFADSFTSTIDTGAAITTDTATGHGTINFNGGATTVASDIGDSTHSINQVNLNTATSTVALNGNNYITSLNVNNTQMRLGANKSLTVGTLSNTSASNGQGSLYFAGGNTLTYNGHVGDLLAETGRKQFDFIQTNGNNTFVSGGGVNKVYTGINGLRLLDDGILTVNGTGTTFEGNDGIQSATNGQGTLNIGSNVIVQGTTLGATNGFIGFNSTHRMNAITFANASGNSLTNDGDIYLTNGINLKDNTLNIRSDYDTTIDTGTAITTDAASGHGTINIVGAGGTGSSAGIVFASAIGDSTHSVNALNLNQTALAFNQGNVTLAATDNYITNTNFVTEGTLQFSNAGTLHGGITTSSAQTGTVSFNTGTFNVTGDIGTASNYLNLLFFSNSATSFGGNVNASTLYFAADNAVNFASGTVAKGNVSIATNNTVTLNYAGGTQAQTGNLGDATHHLAAVNLGSGDNLTYRGTAYVAGNGFRFADGTGTLNLYDFANLGASGNGTLITTAATSGSNTVNTLGAANLYGAVGDSTHAINALNLNGAGSAVNLNADSYINTVAFNNATSGTLSLIGSRTLTGAVTTTNAGTGNLTFGTGSNAVTGNIGTSSLALNQLNFNGTAASLGGDTYATTLNFGANGTATVASGHITSGAITTTTDNTGALAYAGGTQAQTGNIGDATHRLAAVTLASGGSLTYGGTAYIAGNGLQFASGTGTLNIGTGSNFGTSGTGTAITTAATSGSNIINTAGTANFYGAVGDSTHAINALNLNGAASAVSLNANSYINTVRFNNASSGMFSIANGSTLNGLVNTANAGTGNLAFGTGTNAVSGNIGAAGTALNQVNFNGTAASLGGNTYATALNFGANGTATVTSGHLTNGAITTTNDNTGTLAYAGGSQAQTGNIGDATHRLAGLNIASSSFTQTGNVFVAGTNGVQLTNGGTLNVAASNLGSSSAATNITTSSNGTGTVVASGNTALYGNVGTSGARLASLAYTGGSGNTLLLGGNTYLNNIDMSGANSNAVVNFAQGAVLNTSGSISAANAGSVTYRFFMSDSLGTPAAITSAGAIDLTNAKLALDTSGGLANRTSFLIAQSATSNAIIGPSNTAVTLTAPIAGYTFNQVLSSSANNGINNQLSIMALQANYYTRASATTVDGNSSFSSYLDNAVAGRNTDVGGNTVNAYLNTLDSQINAGNIAGTDNTLRQAQPQAQGNQLSNLANQSFLNVVNDHITTQRLASNGVTGKLATAQAVNAPLGFEGGLNTGDVIQPGQAAWMQAFGGVANQDARHNALGFDNKVAGFAGGYDRAIAQNTVLGVAGSYANGRIETDAVAQNTKVDTYQAAIYGNSYVAPRWFVAGQLGGAYNHYDSGRIIPAAGTAASADYNGWGYFANAKTGYDMALQNGYLLTPFTALTYIGNQFDSYTEKGAGGLNLQVAGDHSNLLTGRLGAELAKNYSVGTSKIRPALHLAYLYDLVQDNQTATTSFIGTGVGGSFNTNGIAQSRSGANAGLGLNLLTAAQFDLTATYDYEYRDRYDGHSALLQAKYNF